jgi:acetyl esterase/lipase
MKKQFSKIYSQLFVVGIISICSLNLNAQTGTTLHERRLAQRAADAEMQVKSDAVITRDVVYGSNLNWKGEKEDLKLDVYTPPKTGKKYPFILFVHGGGFVKGDKKSSKNIAKLLVNQDFVVASINYRLGWDQGKKNGKKISEPNEQSANEAKYRAMQDIRASLRYLVANAYKYNIDTNWIFVSGASAGGVAALNLIFDDQESYNKILPDFEKKFGPLNFSSNSLTNSYTVKAIVPMWGALNTMDVVTRGKAIPTLFFQGAKDPVVPYDVGYWYTNPNFSLGYGTKPIYDKLRSMGVSAVAYVDPQGGHGVYSVKFITDIMGCFLKKVIKGEQQSGFYISTEEVKHNCP